MDFHQSRIGAVSSELFDGSLELLIITMNQELTGFIFVRSQYLVRTLSELSRHRNGSR
jgi:hypothetical protein